MSRLLFIFSTICFAMLCNLAMAQSITEYNTDDYQYIDKYIYQQNYDKKDSVYFELFYPQTTQLHSAIKPMSIVQFNDSKNQQAPTHLFETQNKRFQYTPIVNLLPTFSSSGLYALTMNEGSKVSYYTKKRFEFLAQATLVWGTQRQATSILNTQAAWKRADSTEILPHYGFYLTKKKKLYYYLFSDFLLSFSPSDYINLQAGNGRHFWGDGYRSLFLSDNSNSFPYLKTTVNTWRIKYTHLIAALKDPTFSIDPTVNQETGGIVINADDKSDFGRKYASMHYLSLNIARWLNIGLFESVVWNAKDSIGKRGLELNYMNPAIFFRPVDFSLGSPDNVLLGASIKVNLPRKIVGYSQFLFDELVVSELKARNNWWGNKYGIQMGVRFFDFLGVNNLLAQAEYNQVRPFTYSHDTPTKNYGNYLQPLAHPLGANFKEMILNLHYKRKQWDGDLRIVAAQYGIDNDTSNVGHDIYKSYRSRMNFSDERDYNHLQNQGILQKQITSTLRLSYTLLRKKNIKFEIAYKYRITNPDIANSNSLVQFGIRTNIAHRAFDY